MALSDDKLWDLWNAQGTDDMSRAEAFVFARAIEAEARRDALEEAAAAVEKATYRKRWAKAAANSHPDDVPPCEFGALIRAATSERPSLILTIHSLQTLFAHNCAEDKHMQLHTSDQWVINAPLPPSDRDREFLAWVDSGVRTVRRVGNSEHSVFAPGTTIFTDCTHPLQNKICDESRIQGWRLKQ